MEASNEQSLTEETSAEKAFKSEKAVEDKEKGAENNLDELLDGKISLVALVACLSSMLSLHISCFILYVIILLIWL